MGEIEVPLEKVQEDIQHVAIHGHGDGHAESHNFMTWGALISALLAVFAAVTALMAGHHANEAILEQMQASDQWTYYQAKGIKSAIAGIKDDHASVDRYKEEQKEIQDKAHELEASSHHNLHVHQILASGVTFFQVAIAITAISVLTRRRRYLGVALAFGAAGIFFLIQGLLS